MILGIYSGPHDLVNSVFLTCLFYSAEQMSALPDVGSISARVAVRDFFLLAHSSHDKCLTRWKE
jgi:hypothetical protein